MFCLTIGFSKFNKDIIFSLSCPVTLNCWFSHYFKLYFRVEEVTLISVLLVHVVRWPCVIQAQPHPTLCKHLCLCADLFQLLLYLSGCSHLLSRTSPSKVLPSAWFWWCRTRCDRSVFGQRRRSCLWCDVTRLLGCLLWNTSIWNMSSVLCLLLPFPPVMRALHRLMAFSDGTMCYLLLTTVWHPLRLLISCHLSFPLLFTLLSHLSCLISSLFLF